MDRYCCEEIFRRRKNAIVNVVLCVNYVDYLFIFHETFLIFITLTHF